LLKKKNTKVSIEIFFSHFLFNSLSFTKKN